MEFRIARFKRFIDQLLSKRLKSFTQMMRFDPVNPRRLKLII